MEIAALACFGGLLIGLVASNVFAVMRESFDVTETIEIKYMDADIERIEKIDVGDWIDLRCAEDIVMYSGEYKAIPLGVAMKLPEGYEAIVAPRSSTFKKYGLVMANSIGIIDESYCGSDDQWHFLAYAMHGCKIKKNERICQFRIFKHQPPVVLREVDKLSAVNRGGMGSTGRM
jgi:dUTP pyrophosphatase